MTSRPANNEIHWIKVPFMSCVMKRDPREQYGSHEVQLEHLKEGVWIDRSSSMTPPRKAPKR